MVFSQSVFSANAKGEAAIAAAHKNKSRRVHYSKFGGQCLEWVVVSTGRRNTLS
jgi:hypothetical protein